MPTARLSLPRDRDDARTIALICAMADASTRVLTAAELAQHFGCAGLLAFVHDAEIDAPVPAPGFPQSLPGGDGWKDLLARSRSAGVHRGHVDFPVAGQTQPAAALSLAGGTVFVLVGGDDTDAQALAQPPLALLDALLRTESRTGSADARAAAAQDMARHSKALMSAVDAARAAAEEATVAKDQFLAMLGHELRNPLSPIVTALQLLRLRGQFDAHRELGIIERQVEHLVTLVDDLLDVSRITRGKIDLRLEDVEICQAVLAAVEVASPLLEQRCHRLTLDVPRSGLRVRADLLRLKQVIANLLTNAAKYTPPNGLIHLCATREGEEVALSVRDNGMGIPAEMLPRIFELFVQSDRSPEQLGGGLGIGLTLVRSLARLHGGSVTASSGGPGQGAEFTLRLPALPASAVDELPVVVDPVLASHRRAVRKRRILLVDDNADAAKMLAHVLNLVGHEVVTAHDGPQALATAEALDPEVAILDIGLPVMDGYELGRQLRARPHPPRLIALTGYGQSQDRARSAAAGFECHLVKPVDADRMLDAIDALG